jgi:capsid protein
VRGPAGVANWAGALVGAGIFPAPGHPDKDTRARLTAYFQSWADDADANGRTGLWGLQADIARALVICGKAFVQTIMTEAGPKLRLIPPELVDASLTRELSDGANYCSLRAGLLPFRQRREQTQYGTLVPQLLRPIWRCVVTFGVPSGKLAAPNFKANTKVYLACEWLSPKPMQVDPMKDVQATVAELDAGLTSRRKAVAERGWALEDLDEEIAADPSPPKQSEQDNAA